MPRILIYEDHRCILELYKREFREEGYDVVAASNLCEALECFRAETPALVLFSIGRPGVGDLDAIAQMLSINRRTPIVFTGPFIDRTDPDLAELADARVEQLSDLAVLKQTIRDLCPSGPATRMILSKPPRKVRSLRRQAV